MTTRELKKAALLYALSAGLFLFPLAKGKTLFAGDVTYSFQPWLTYAAQEIQAGRFPLWNPYNACGEPLVGNSQIMLFSPLAILYWIFPFGVANALFLLLSHGLLFIFVYLLARRWAANPAGNNHSWATLGALTVTWSGFAVAHQEFASAIGTLPFVPLLFVLGLGRKWRELSLATALALMTGYIQFVYYGVFLALLGSAFSPEALIQEPQQSVGLERGKSLLFAILCVAGGVLLAGVQVLPSWATARDSLRSDIPWNEVLKHRLSWAFLLKFWIPNITNTVAMAFESTPFGPEFWSIQRPWLSTFFMGTSTMILATLGLARTGWKKNALLLFTVSTAAILAFGIEPLFGAAVAVLPGWRYLTHFSNSMVMVLIALALWASDPAPARRTGVFLAALVAGVMLATSLALAAGPRAQAHVLKALLGIKSLNAAQSAWVSQAGGRSAAMILAVVGIGFFFRRGKIAALGLFAVAELWALGHGMQPTAPGSFFHQRLGLAMEKSSGRISLTPQIMKEGKPIFGSDLVDGYSHLREVLYPNISLPFRRHHTWGYEVFGNSRFAEFRRAMADLPGACPPLDFLGVDKILSTRPLPPPAELIGRRPDTLLYRRSGALARVTVVGRAVTIIDPTARLQYLYGPWDPTREVVLEIPADFPLTDPQLIDWDDSVAGKVIAHGHGAGWLVNSGVYDTDWKARVNGAVQPMWRANHAFQAVRVPDGDWTVQLQYAPRAFYWGAAMALFGLLWVSIL